ncbi:hypothetical protein C3747_2g134 [Trypanosoma cruzi]|uniref:Uncharacterized protein n=1 Tax=Trypanosoma cruzi TaxID=5693 RepID=A0A2V2XLS0_TRYCR|nr:hypothetical protein C3747_2g134 [Trypanosoma cruzi]
MRSDGTALSKHQKVGQLIKLWAAEATRHPKHRPPPPTLTNARGLAPNNYGIARPRPTAVALGTGAWPRRNAWRGLAPSRPCGEACLPRLFDRRPNAGTVSRIWQRGVIIPSSTRGKRHSTATPPTRHAGQLPRPAHVTHPCRTHPRCHRVPVDSAAIWLQARRFRPRPIAAPQGGHASQHPKAPHGGCLCGPRQGFQHGRL